MTVDISKIKPGDKVTLVPLEVEDKTKFAVDIIFKGERHWISADLIAAHHPAPREFQVGDRVGMNGEVGTLLCVDDTDAWVRWDTGYRSTRPAARLTLMEAGQ